MTALGALYWLGLAGAAAAVVIYFVQIAILRKTVRLVSGAGLFFTGIGLGEAAIAMQAAAICSESTKGRRIISRRCRNRPAHARRRPSDAGNA